MGRFALVRKKEKWGITWFGKIFGLLLLMVAFLLYVFNIVSFLSPVNPVNSDVLIVEGFIPDHAIEESKKIFESGSYSLMLITGKKRMKGAHLDIYKNDGEYSAATLDSMGFEMDKLIVVPMTENITKDRTYYSAVAIKKWLEKNRPDLKKADLVTFGCHARRSRYLYELALGDQYQVGIYATDVKVYTSNNWWRSSYGFRDVMQETIAWIYARFFFYPTG